MAHIHKYAVNEALRVINGSLFSELRMYRFDEPTRTKVHLFSVNGKAGRQFGIILGDTDAKTGHHSAQQTRIVLEKCKLPEIFGIESTENAYLGSRLKQADSKIRPDEQASCVVADEASLRTLLKWYATPCTG